MLWRDALNFTRAVIYTGRRYLTVQLYIRGKGALKRQGKKRAARPYYS